MATTTSPDPNFTPRKEFARQQKQSSNSFALLAVAQTSFIRFYSFPRSVVFSLRSLFDDRGILSGFREDEPQNLCEFTLEGKPWANSKGVTTEKLLVDIITIIYQCGYTFLSTLDYGRENDDRLAMAFSKPGPSITGSRSGTPLPSYTSPLHDYSGSCISERSKNIRIPFAISFASTTLMRVIAPPLHLTPAILQAVRGSWPRGVVSEKKVGDSSFEFKLKGYKWFQQDTFATDSLRHILSLLSSLDSQSFTLLSSISLNPNRSRVKDLWIFTGPNSLTEEILNHDSPASSILTSAHGEIKRKPGSPSHHSQVDPPQNVPPQHQKLITEPIISTPSSHPSQHTRSISDSRSTYQHRDNCVPPIDPPLPNVLRKPAPLAQASARFIDETETGNGGFRANIPSLISNPNENMTGVGTTGFSQHAYYGGDTSGRVLPPISPTPIHAANMRPRSVTPPSHGRSHLPVSSRSKTPPLLRSHSPSPLSSPTRRGPIHHGQHVNSIELPYHDDLRGPSGGTPPLLDPEVFRDSAFSSNSGISRDIPIKWTGGGNTSEKTQITQTPRANLPVEHRVSSSGLLLPGAWQPSPIEERYEEEDGMINNQSNLDTSEGATTPIREVVSRILSPEMNNPDVGLRKSEAALVSMIPQTMPSKARDIPNSGTGQGWVLVNVEGTSSPTFGETDSSHAFPRTVINYPGSSSGGTHTPRFPTSEYAAASPEAKAIVIIDAVESNNKLKSKMTQGPPTRGRFFSLGKKFSKTPWFRDQQKDDNTKPPLDKSSPPSTSETSRNRMKRRSFD